MCIHVVNVRGMNAPAAREAVCYVGRPFAGWVGHRLANPFRTRAHVLNLNGSGAALVDCLNRYRQWLLARQTLENDLLALWEECDRGAKPLGCWCVNSFVGDGKEIGCHAQILARMLADRFGTIKRSA